MLCTLELMKKKKQTNKQTNKTKQKPYAAQEGNWQPENISDPAEVMTTSNTRSGDPTRFWMTCSWTATAIANAGGLMGNATIRLLVMSSLMTHNKLDHFEWVFHFSVDNV